MLLREMFLKELIHRDFIEIKFEGPVWKRRYAFVDENWERRMDTMSEKQKAYARAILDDCVEKRIEG